MNNKDKYKGINIKDKYKGMNNKDKYKGMNIKDKYKGMNNKDKYKGSLPSTGDISPTENIGDSQVWMRFYKNKCQ